jgi:hypothetical protein
MKIITTVATSFALCALAACNNSPAENAADSIEANAEMTADNLEVTADNATTDNGEAALQNQADATRAAGDNAAEDMVTNEPDTNTANGM